jgi:hypothetical protein
MTPEKLRLHIVISGTYLNNAAGREAANHFD